jgi:hypothetical protein
MMVNWYNMKGRMMNFFDQWIERSDKRNVCGWKHGKIDQKNVTLKMQFENDRCFDINTWK